MLVGDKSSIKGHCNTAEDLKKYLQNKGRHHNYYKTFSKIEHISQIIHEKVLYLSDGQNWNDVDDRAKLQQCDTYKLFAKCFSFSKSEDVAMWMLYGGVYHTGAMVDFTREAMNSILEIPSIDVGYFSNDEFQTAQTLDRQSFKIWLTDIVYCDKETGYMKRADESSKGVPREVLERLQYCEKDCAWSYENECRLIVAIDRGQRLDNCNNVRINLRNVKLGVSLSRAYYCPQYRGEKIDGFQPSEMDGKVSWELLDEKCQKCRDKKCSKCTNAECPNKEKGDRYL